MKLELVFELGCDLPSRIRVEMDNKQIIWTQRTPGSVGWAGQVASKVKTTFPQYKLANFNYSLLPNGEYDVNAVWKKME